MTRKNGQIDRTKKCQTPRAQSQESFVRLYEKCDGDIKIMAGKLGQAYDTVYKRCYRLQLTKRQAVGHKEAGQVIAMVEQTISKAKRRKREQRPVDTSMVEGLGARKFMIDGGSSKRAEGYAETSMQFTFFQALEKEYRRVQALNDWLEQELRQLKATGKRVTGYHIDIVCKLVRESRSTVTELHKIQQEQYSTRGAQIFIEAVTNLLMDEVPDARERLYVKLALLGSPAATTLAGPKDSPNRSL